MTRCTPVPPRRPHEDPGLQPERTTLAWNRTLMSFVIVAALFLRWFSTQGLAVVALLAGAVAVAVGIWWSQRHHYRRGAASIAQEQSRAAVRPTVFLGASVFLLGAAGLLVIIF